MKPQKIHPVVEDDDSKRGKVEGHGKLWMHVGSAHPHTPDRNRNRTAKEDENVALAGASG